jgi:hypothetical protein
MELIEIEIGRKYLCDCRGGRYFAVVRAKSNTDVSVAIGDKINESGVPGNALERLGLLGIIAVSSDSIHEM